MNTRNALLAAFAVLVIAQWAVPAGMILRREASMVRGNEFKLRVRPVDPYDAFRGRYVQLGFDPITVPPPGGVRVVPGQKAYALLKADSAGFVMVEAVTSTAPKDGDYLEVTLRPDANFGGTGSGRAQIVWPFDRYYMEETVAPAAERVYRDQASSTTAYVTVRVLNGTGVITGLYLDGVPIEQKVREM